jgi:D-aminopeptidase
VAFGFKGGIGTSSRRPSWADTQSAFSSKPTTVACSPSQAPRGRELGRYDFRNELEGGSSPDQGKGSVMVVVATDAPVDARNLKRMAARAMLGLGRTGASGSNGSGDYVISFSAASQMRIRAEDKNSPRHIEVLGNEAMSPLFLAVIEATEEAVYNSLLRATTIDGRGHTVEALPLERTTEQPDYNKRGGMCLECP